MQRPRAFDLAELVVDLGQALFDQAAVRFELRLAGAAKKAEAAPLTFQMCPRAYQPASLIGQVRVFDLQRALARARAPAKNLQNKAGAIQHLCVPRFLEIALLHWRQCAIHDHDAGLEAFDEPGNLIDLPFAEIGRRPQCTEHDDAGLLDGEINGARQTDRLVEPRRGRTLTRTSIRRGAAQDRFDDERPPGGRS
jgi:hypothetical protein